MSDILKPCPFCGGMPDFGWVEEKDERRYVQLDLICCVTMSDTLSFHEHKSLSDDETEARLKTSLAESWNRRTPPKPSSEPTPKSEVDEAGNTGWMIP